MGISHTSARQQMFTPNPNGQFAGLHTHFRAIPCFSIIFLVLHATRVQQIQKNPLKSMRNVGIIIRVSGVQVSPPLPIFLYFTETYIEFSAQ
jgi:hypothetical protein